MPKQFIPYHDIRKYDRVLVVDSHHPAGFTLSHWRGAPVIPTLHDATSTGIVLNALKAQIPELAYPHVTNNHFDIDGFLGIWALYEPGLALEYEHVLRQMALIGDFRELDTSVPETDLALKLVCWINAVEKDKFYGPFEAPEHQEKEAVLCIPKYHYFLEVFGRVLRNPELFADDWIGEYQRVQADMVMVQSPLTTIRNYPEIGLRVVESPQPLHYYALFHGSAAYSMVLSLYEGQRYELEYKYTTWVDTGRPSYPRIHLKPLAEKLTAAEPGQRVWHADSLFDTGPILRIEESRLNKAERFDHPYKRTILSSGLDKDTFTSMVHGYFSHHLKDLSRQPFWTWAETRRINEALLLN